MPASPHQSFSKAAYSAEFLQAIKGKRFRHPATGNQVLFVSLPPEEQHRIWDQWHREGAERAFIEQMEARQDVSGIGHDDPRQVYATYSPDFMRLVESTTFRNPDTGNMVKFVSLPPKEQERIHANYQRNLAMRQQQQQAPPAKPKKKPKRPTFAKAREAVFPALEEAGWTVKPGLKVPKAEREIDDNKVILHFKPQAVWMEVRGRERTPPRSLHVDIRDIAHDPSKWIEELGAEAEGRVKSEEEFMAPYRKSAQTVLRRRAETRVARRHLEKSAAYDPEFMKAIGQRRFRHPETGNRVLFVSLPPHEQTEIYKIWQNRQKSRAEQEKRDRERYRRMGEEAAAWKPGDSVDVTMLPKGSIVKDPDTGKEYEILSTSWSKARTREIGGKPGWTTMYFDRDPAVLVRRGPAETGGPSEKTEEAPPRKKLPQPQSPYPEYEEREPEIGEDPWYDAKYRDLPIGPGPFNIGLEDPRPKAASMTTLEDWTFLGKKAFGLPGLPGATPGGPPKPPGFGEIEEEPPPPAQVKMELANRMREMGRTLMVSGMRAPRQQIIDIGKVLNGLIDQLELLSDQPGRAALKRRIFLGLRNRVLSSR